MELLKKVIIEINKGINRTIKAKQKDTARYLLFTIVDNGVPFSLQGKEVKVFGIKPDGKLVFNSCQVTNSTNGETKLNLTSQILAVPGILKAELVISENNQILSTIPFEIEIIKSLRDDSAVESTNEFSVLLSKIKEGQTLEESISDLITEGKPLYDNLRPVVEAGKELNTSLPPKTSEADSILKQLLQAIQNGNLNNYASNENLKDYVTRLGEHLEEIDLNTVVKGGFYAVAKYNSKNLPIDSDGNLLVLPWYDSNNWCSQIFIEDDTGKMYTRTSKDYLASKWSPWAIVYTSDNKPTALEIGAADAWHNHDDRYMQDIQAEPLWSGCIYLNKGQNVPISKNIKECRNGWVLIFSDYDPGGNSSGNNYNYVARFIPKNSQIINSGNMLFLIPNTENGANTVKVAYIKEREIQGQSVEGISGWNDVVLRQVLEF